MLTPAHIQVLKDALSVAFEGDSTSNGDGYNEDQLRALDDLIHTDFLDDLAKAFSVLNMTNLAPSVVDSILERQRQITEEGYTPEEDKNRGDQLGMAASCYLKAGASDFRFERATTRLPIVPDDWPWNHVFWKPRPDRRRALVKGVALGLAAIDQLDRQPKKEA